MIHIYHQSTHFHFIGTTVFCKQHKSHDRNRYSVTKPSPLFSVLLCLFSFIPYSFLLHTFHNWSLQWPFTPYLNFSSSKGNLNVTDAKHIHTIVSLTLAIFLLCYYFQISYEVLVSNFIPSRSFLNTPQAQEHHLYCL
jgi:hypothetical protein